jgi:hypothetical protein
MLVYGIPADLVDDHLAMGEIQAIKCVKWFAVAMVKVFGEVYLRAPNEAHTSRLLKFNLFEQRVELGIRRSIWEQSRSSSTPLDTYLTSRTSLNKLLQSLLSFLKNQPAVLSFST